MHVPKRLIPVLGTVLSALILGACRGDDVNRAEDGSLVLGGTVVEDTITRGVNPGSRTLVLDGFNGNIRLEGVGGQTATVQFVKKARGRNDEAARELLNEIQIQESGDAEAYRYVMTSEEPAQAQVDISGQVPRGTNLRIELLNGSVALSGITGPISIEQQNGNVRIGGAAGNVQAVTQTGTIDAGFQQVPPNAEVALRTTNGNVSLTIPATTSARVEAETQVGNIQVGPGLNFTNQSLSPEGAGSTFEGRLGAGNAVITLSTQNGTIRIEEGTASRLPTDAPARTPPAPSSPQPDSAATSR